ncbi:Stage II sporulation protein E (SpoIIE) [Novipirellula galeiformis]|uniref:Stage II sporulation protein E (SpoIIE) n=1 Tax=Novipirellula galeiformis TaxID=2528004 RepID=A0A5C6CHY1_9BACT|nr:SpoIIE family protein phosphatase [Novipirellula galeiformis]TWU24240.1 Stage II sporulation protein E (SpoIIE) [Novipirellula galeiformis]
MTKTIPNYLRIHKGPASKAAPDLDPSGDAVSHFWHAFGDATGWRLDNSRRRVGSSIELLPSVNTMAVSDPSEASPTVTKSSAMRLAESAAMLAEQLNRSRESLRRQEMELATRASIVPGAESQSKLADKIETILADACEAVNCRAAAMYLLDDDTQLLKARSVFGLPASRLEDPPRELRGSRGDLEAMVQGVVTADHFMAGDIDTWNSPEPFTGGICASINHDGVPIGTLWLFSDDIRAFGKAEAALGRLAASHLAAELSHAASDRTSSPQLASTSSIRDLSEWQHLSLPAGSRIADGWFADGMIESPQSWATGFHTWDVLPDGTLMMAMAESVDSTLRGALQTVVVRTAITAHSHYRHSAAQMLQRINDTLWHTNAGDQLMSMLYMQIDPETGDGSFASCGDIMAMVCSRYGYRPLVDGRSEPLGSHITASPTLNSFSLLPGETLLAYNQGMRIDGATQTLLGDRLRGCLQTGDKNPLAAIRRGMINQTLNNERGAITLLRS